MVAKEISFPDFLRAVAIPMFGFAIVNPMGPTFMGFAIGKTNSGNSSLLFFSLNPFSQTAEEISTFNFDPHNIDADSLLKDYGLCFEIDKFLVGKKSDRQEFATPTLLFGNLGGDNLKDITISTKKNRDYIYLSVCNDGLSIPASSRRHLFERFEQGQPSAKRNRAGAGLGLAIVKEICISHQADISFTSAATKTCFQFRFVR